MLNETERSKAEKRNWKKKDLPGFFLFENLPYLKCKITSEFLIHFSPFSFLLLLSLLAGVRLLGLRFLFPCPTFCFSGPVKVLESFSVSKGQMQRGCSGWIHLENGCSLRFLARQPFSGWGKPFYFILTTIPFPSVNT